MNIRLSIIPAVLAAMSLCASAGITYESTSDDQHIRIELDDDWKLIRAEMDGQDVPPERVRITEEAIEVLDESGEVVHRMERLRDFGPARVLWTEPGEVGIAPRVALAPIPRVQIGIVMSNIDDSLARQIGVGPDEGFVIREVREGLPAEKAGLRNFDVVTKINGEAPASGTRLMNTLSGMKPGEELGLTVVREGDEKEFTLVVAEREAVGGAWEFALGENSAQARSMAEAQRAWAEAMDRMRLLDGADDERSDAERARVEEELARARARLDELYSSFPRISPFRTDTLNGKGVIVAPPDTLRIERNLNDRLNTMELRMERIEQLLERLVEEKTGDTPEEKKAPEAESAPGGSA